MDVGDIIKEYLKKNKVDIVKKYLEENDFDGLFNEEGECACENSDLYPCDRLEDECQPGYKISCPSVCGGHDWHITEDLKGRDRIE